MTLPLPLNTVSAGAEVATQAADNGRAYTDIKGLEGLKGDTQSPQALKRIAQEVEAMFLQMMLKSMRDASLGDGIFDSQEGRLYQDMFDKQIALDMSQHQHIGISELLMRQLAHKSAEVTAAPSITPATSSAMPLPGRAPDVAAEETGGRRAAAAEATDASAAEFVTQVLPSIRQAARKLGVDARALLAQAALETGWGQRMPRNADGSSSHNLFGIKAGAGWVGGRANALTIEFDGLVAQRRAQAFRSYASMEDSVNDFARLLADTPRYAEALSQGSSPRDYAHALAAAGYATDPDYARKINRILDSARMRAAFPVRAAALQK